MDITLKCIFKCDNRVSNQQTLSVYHVIIIQKASLTMFSMYFSLSQGNYRTDNNTAMDLELLLTKCDKSNEIYQRRMSQFLCLTLTHTRQLLKQKQLMFQVISITHLFRVVKTCTHKKKVKEHPSALEGWMYIFKPLLRQIRKQFLI